jgi:hypothetical protein
MIRFWVACSGGTKCKAKVQLQGDREKKREKKTETTDETPNELGVQDPNSVVRCTGG